MPKIITISVITGHIDERSPTAANWTTTTNSVDAGAVVNRKKRIILIPSITPSSNERFSRFNRFHRIHRATLRLVFTSNTLAGYLISKQMNIQSVNIAEPSWNQYNTNLGRNWVTPGGDRLETLSTVQKSKTTGSVVDFDMTKTVGCEKHYLFPSDIAFSLETHIYTYLDDNFVINTVPPTGQITFSSDNSATNKPTMILTYTPVQRKLRTRRAFPGRASR